MARQRPPLSPYVSDGDRWFIRGRFRTSLQCFVEDCENNMSRRVRFTLYCDTHLYRLKRHGSIEKKVRSFEEIVDDIEMALDGYTSDRRACAEEVAERLGMKPPALSKALERHGRHDLRSKMTWRWRRE